MEHISKKNLRLIIENLLFEDIRYGMYDQPGPQLGDPDEEEKEKPPELTVPSNVPIQPNEMMASQLADEKPPIEDEDYKPSNVKELQRASASLASLVPDDQVEFFYKEMHRLVDKAAEKQNAPEEEDNTLGDPDKGARDTPIDPKKDSSEEEKLKGESRIREGYDDDSRYGGYSDAEYDEMGMSILPDEDFAEFEPAAEEIIEKTPEEDGDATFEKIADEFGFAGAPGARQYVDKLLKRMQYFAVELDRKEIQDLKDTATDAFIDLFADPELGLMDPEEVETMMAQPVSVQELDSFRHFFVAAFVLPAVQAVQRNGRKALEAHLKSTGVPKELWQTIVNQATGGAERNPEKLAKKIGKVAAKLGLSEEEAVKMGKELETSFASLKSIAAPSGDMADLANSRWTGMQRDKQLRIFVQSLQSTSEDMKEFGIDLDDYAKKPVRKGFGPKGK